MILFLSLGQMLWQKEVGRGSWRRDKNVHSALFWEVTALKRKSDVKVKAQSYERVRLGLGYLQCRGAFQLSPSKKNPQKIWLNALLLTHHLLQLSYSGLFLQLYDHFWSQVIPHKH